IFWLQRPDRSSWEALFRGYIDFYKVDIPSGGFDTVWGWVFDSQNPFWCDLAVDEVDRPVGFVHYQLWHASLSGGMTCYMADLFVEPAERGRGAGRLLIDNVCAFAKSRGLPSVAWLTQETNYAARRLYDTYRPRSEFVFYAVPT
ncbi:MAG: GNAT family N-acetyltransferase, partial [Pseudomonadota bacterium]